MYNMTLSYWNFVTAEDVGKIKGAMMILVLDRDMKSNVWYKP